MRGYPAKILSRNDLLANYYRIRICSSENDDEGWVLKFIQGIAPQLPCGVLSPRLAPDRHFHF
jgi:hypothetical protein